MNKLIRFIAAIFALIVLQDKLEAQSIQIDCDKCDLRILADTVHFYNISFEPNKTLSLADSLLAAHNDHVCPDIVRIKTSRAYANEHLYKYDTAIEIYNEVIKIAIANQFKDQEIDINIALARVYEILKRPEICKEYLDKTRQLLQRHENKGLQSHYFVRLASYHRIFGDKEQALKYANAAIKIGEESGRLGSLAGGNLILGFLTEDFELSIQYLQKASHYCQEEGDYMGFLFQDMNIASKYLSQGEPSKALSLLNAMNTEIEGLSKNEKNYYQVKSYHSEYKARTYEALGQKDSLIIALKEVNEFSGLFGNMANQEKINQLITDNVVSQEKAKVEVVRKTNRWLFISLGILLAVLLGLLGLYFSNVKKSKQIEEQAQTISKQYKKLEELYNYQSTLLSEVHHRIKNNLQLIISLLVLQKDKMPDSSNKRIIDMLSYRISSISLIHEQLYNLKEFDKIDVRIYAKDLIHNFSTLTSLKNVAFNFDVNDSQINLETITPLGMIWSELISNSLKYNQTQEALNIFISLKNDRDNYSMHYFDNGSGYPEGQFMGNESGMGYNIINSLARQLFAKTNTYNDNGAHFTMIFKEKAISPL